MVFVPRFAALIRITAVAAAVFGVVLPAHAQDRALCARLTSQLYDYVSDRPPSRHFNRFAVAVDDMLQLIERTEHDMKRMGCASGSVIIYGNSEHSDCRRLAADMKRMQSDLRLFERKRDAHAGRSGSTARDRIIAALHANGCDVPGGVRIRETLGVSGDDGLFDLNNPNVRYRTLCVRTCDGYYFPISYSASPMTFDSDAAQCNAMCPGSRVQLYFHRTQGQDSEDMVSVADQMPYTALPNAFAYRKRDFSASQQCSCDAPPQPVQSGSQSDPGSSIVKLQTAKPPLTTHDDSATDIVEPPVRDLDPDRRVRVVGPMFLPDQSEAIDLQAQDRIDYP
ncbi:MAG: DUF2865 domain-containing protein [Alphaproteobacteria bacterium]|nr:DUF2865 domain-containing protein [Alphaproteobacteria bacterium]